MPEFKLVHAGFDKFDAAFRGALDGRFFPVLNAAKEAAQRQDEPYLIDLGPGKVPVLVSDRGMSGGYAFKLNSGPLGANFFIKEDVRQMEWNVFMASLSQGLLGYGYREYWQRNLQALKDMGARLAIESINRVDFAMDFVTSGFELKPDLFVAPPRTKSTAHSGDWEGNGDDSQLLIVTAGRAVQSVTIGRMPGRQIIVYDKRAEAIAKNTATHSRTEI
jgi:hypothetical protein